MSKAEDKYSKRRLKSSYITTVVSITLVLFMLGMLGLIILHAKKLSDYVKENIGFSIIMKENVKEAGIIQLQKTLDASDYVKSTEYITKEKAAEELTKDLGEDFIDFLDNYEESVNDKGALNQLYEDVSNYEFLIDESKIIRGSLEDYDDSSIDIETSLISIDGFSSKKKNAEEFIVKLQNIGIENIARELKKLREQGDQTKLKNYFNKIKNQFSILQGQGKFFNNFLDAITNEKAKVEKEDKRYDKITDLFLDVFDTKEDKESYSSILKNFYGLKVKIKAKLEKVDKDNLDIVFIKTKYSDLKEKIVYIGMLYERLREVEAKTNVLEKHLYKFKEIKQKLENNTLAVLKLGGYRGNNCLDSLNRFYLHFKDEESKRALEEIRPLMREIVEEEVNLLRTNPPTNNYGFKEYIARFERYTNKLMIIKNHNLIKTLEEGLFFLYEISDPDAHNRAEGLQNYIRANPDLLEKKPLFNPLLISLYLNPTSFIFAFNIFPILGTYELKQLYSSSNSLKLSCFLCNLNPIFLAKIEL